MLLQVITKFFFTTLLHSFKSSSFFFKFFFFASQLNLILVSGQSQKLWIINYQLMEGTQGEVVDYATNVRWISLTTVLYKTKLIYIRLVSRYWFLLLSVRIMSTLLEELHCVFDNSSTDEQKLMRFGMLAHNFLYFNIMVKKILVN